MKKSVRSDALFVSMAPAIMRMLIRDFAPFTIEDAGAVLGSLGHESGGFKFLQEKKPLVPGSRGGWGWAQWTGPRRRGFEGYCHGGNLDPSSAEANYGYLVVELRGSEKKAIPAVRAAGTLLEKVTAFELNFERASPKYKHYESRFAWAEKAIAAYHAKPDAAPIITPRLPAHAPAPPPVARAPDLENEIAVGIVTDRRRIKDVQQSLQEFGYPPGGLDGLIGNLTVQALAGYRHDRGLPASDKIDKALLADMMKAAGEKWTRPVTVERATIPEKEIAKKSRTLQVSWWGKILGALGIPTAGVAGQAVKDMLDPDQLDVHLSMLQRVGSFVGENYILIGGVVAGGLVAWGAFRLIDRFKVEDYRLGIRP